MAELTSAWKPAQHRTLGTKKKLSGRRLLDTSPWSLRRKASERVSKLPDLTLHLHPIDENGAVIRPDIPLLAEPCRTPSIPRQSACCSRPRNHPAAWHAYRRNSAPLCIA